MPTVAFPLDYLRRLTDTSPADLVQHAFDYGLDAVLREFDLEVEVTAERPDLLAAEGFIRAMNIYVGQPRSLPEQLEPSGLTVRVSPAVQALRPYIAGLVVENVSLGQAGLASLIQFQEKVAQTFGRQRQKIAIGIYNRDRIQGDVDYAAVHKDELRFAPIKSDRSLTAREILAEHPNGKLYRHILPPGDQVPVLRDSQGTVLSLPPIINAAGAGEVTSDAHNLFVDVTGTSQRAVLEMINILAHNFIDAGAPVKTVTIQAADGELVTPDLTPKPITFSARFLNEMLGTAIPKHLLGTYLSRMDLTVTGTDVILVPTYRTDILSEIDLAGDLMVAVGIANLQPEPTALRFHMGLADPIKDYGLRVGDQAQRMGLMEVKSFVLTDPELLQWFSPRHVQTGNAKSRTLSAARTTLQAGLLDILSRNISTPKPINIYEVGEVISLETDGSAQETVAWGFATLDARASFTTAKAYVQTLLKALQIPYALIPCKESRYIPGRAATVLVADTPVGHFGEIHPAILSQFSFPEPVCSGELDCGLLVVHDKQRLGWEATL